MARKGFQSVLDEITGDYARRLKSEWRKMTDKYMLEDARLEPMVMLSIKESWAEFTLRYVVDYKERRSTKDKICVRILQVIEQSKNEISFGTSSFEIATAPQLDVNVKNRQ